MRIPQTFASVFFGRGRGAGIILLTALCCSIASAAVVDRVAVVVGKIVITESEVQQEVRIAEFLNGEPLDLGAQKRREAADRLVDQQLIRNEMEVGSYPKPAPAEVQAVLRKFQQEHYPNINDFRAALQKYGLTEDQLQQHLSWQLAALHFTDLRFRGPAPAESGSEKTTSPANSANRTAPSAGPDSETGNIDQQLDSWLKEARGQVRIQFKKEAFQ